MWIFFSKLNCLFYLFCFFMISPSSTLAQEVEIHFIPFQIDTYAPITTQTINLEAWERWTIAEISEVKELEKLLKTGEGVEFDGNRVRSSIRFHENTIYVDAGGVASTDGKRGVKIDTRHFMKFRKSQRYRTSNGWQSTPTSVH